MEKAHYVIESKPVRISVVCPSCDETQLYDYESVYTKFGADAYYGNCGSVECSSCKKDIELGNCEYD
ncbi:hypothetical protein A5881_002949 [Enterococcus termitis]|nr:hypothetical protein A5881_002396 [Enterococcus termitis]